MKKTIFNVYVAMTSQEQCDRMKAVCLENGLNKEIYDSDFDFSEIYRFFLFAMDGFFIASSKYSNTQVTEAEFLELLKDYKLNK